VGEHCGGPGARQRVFRRLAAPWLGLIASLWLGPAAASEPMCAPQAGTAPPSVLEGLVRAPAELVRSAAGGRPPGFGESVALLPSMDGRIALLAGAPAGHSVRGGGLVLGAARVGRPGSWGTGGANSWWSGPETLTGGPGVPVREGADDQHGQAVAAAPAWAALGAPSASLALSRVGATLHGRLTGAVTMLHLDSDGGSGRCTQWLQGPSGEGAGGFGSALAFLVEGGATKALAVGSPFADDPASGLPMVGAVHLFEPLPLGGGATRPRWERVLTIRPDAPRIGMSFGASLAWIGGALAIGAPGDSTLSPGAGSVHGVSRAGQPRWTLRSGEPGARLGATLCSLDVAWGTGEPGLAASAPGRGVVHVYDLMAGSPHGIVDLRGRPGAGFGLALAAADRHLFVGAPFAGSDGVPLAGVVYRFVAGPGRVAVETLRAPEPTVGGEFGVSAAALRGGDGVLRLAVGEPGSHDGCPSSSSSCRPGRVAVFALP
jgi:hypothetical protein